MVTLSTRSATEEYLLVLLHPFFENTIHTLEIGLSAFLELEMGCTWNLFMCHKVPHNDWIASSFLTALELIHVVLVAEQVL